MITTLFLLGAMSAATPAEAPADINAWVAQVNKQIERHIRVPADDESGMATVSFRRDENGRPVDVIVRSGSPTLARAAVNTIKAAGVLPPMPASVSGHQRITFNFLVGAQGRRGEYDRQFAAMVDSAKHTNLATAARLGSKTQVAARERR